MAVFKLWTFCGNVFARVVGQNEWKKKLLNIDNLNLFASTFCVNPIFRSCFFFCSFILKIESPLNTCYSSFNLNLFTRCEKMPPLFCIVFIVCNGIGCVCQVQLCTMLNSLISFCQPSLKHSKKTHNDSLSFPIDFLAVSFELAFKINFIKFARHFACVSSLNLLILHYVKQSSAQRWDARGKSKFCL